MGKRSVSIFARKKRDAYDTPPSAVSALIGHLAPRTRFWEPCAGKMALADELTRHGHRCVRASDIKPRRRGIHTHGMMMCGEFIADYCGAECFITNTPWPSPGSSGEPVISAALHLASIRPTWLLLSADFAHNSYFAQLQPICVKIVSVGRVSWEQNGTAGKDNAAWYLFDASHIGATRFFGKVA